jgi:hypothetical protein
MLFRGLKGLPLPVTEEERSDPSVWTGLIPFQALYIYMVSHYF